MNGSTNDINVITDGKRPEGTAAALAYGNVSASAHPQQTHKVEQTTGLLRRKPEEAARQRAKHVTLPPPVSQRQKDGTREIDRKKESCNLAG
ncbi:hypothetical protein EYF80_059909 [Liparis tanakae]|uniref:Uncharacterized protein n=1 Tax=Liparis tanakae TaxID=230148 RepID=A0A4Z2ENH9_9TELE|nr:hypothetical protein EYF80_059909 [Liparis tanakae]